VPHIGWNTIAVTRASALLDGVAGADVYFAHSFAAEPDDADVVSATTDHGGRVVAAVEDATIAGVQFHPERSAAAGARVLENLLRWSRSA
jgi:glutamine amidotransferase